MLESMDSRGVDRAAPPGEGGVASDRAMANGPEGRGIRSGAGLVRESRSGMPAEATAREGNEQVGAGRACHGVVPGAGGRGSRGSVIEPILAPTDPAPHSPAAVRARAPGDDGGCPSLFTDLGSMDGLCIGLGSL